MGTHEPRLFDAMAIADLGPPIATPANHPRNQSAELLGDPLLTAAAREHLMEAIMNQTLPHLTPADTETAAERMMRLGREEGREEGRLEGMMELAADDLTPSLLAQARAIDALPELNAYLKRCLSNGH